MGLCQLHFPLMLDLVRHDPSPQRMLQLQHTPRFPRANRVITHAKHKQAGQHRRWPPHLRVLSWRLRRRTCGLAAPAPGRAADPAEYYFRTTPVFEIGSEKYAWLNRTVAVGVGRRTPTGVAYTV